MYILHKIQKLKKMHCPPSAPCQSAVCLQPPFCWWEGGAGALLMLFALQRLLPVRSCLSHTCVPGCTFFYLLASACLLVDFSAVGQLPVFGTPCCATHCGLTCVWSSAGVSGCGVRLGSQGFCQLTFLWPWEGLQGPHVRRPFSFPPLPGGAISLLLALREAVRSPCVCSFKRPTCLPCNLTPTCTTVHLP